jgi:hypothetical protein
MRGWVATLLAVVVGAVAAPAGACPLPVDYPGDNAPKATIAQWMARGAIAAALPGELPVMGALVESDVTNLGGGDSDAVGYFGMRVGIWNQGPYAGFPDHPELQLRWFVDQATMIRQMRIAAGDVAFGSDESKWGEWVADVEQPAEQFRGRYQLRLADARALIGPPCNDAPPDQGTPGGGASGVPAPVPPAPAAPPARDVVAPVLRLDSAHSQPALRRRAIVVVVGCPAESCVASAAATLRVPGERRAFKLVSPSRGLSQGQTATLRLALRAPLRAAVRRAVRAHRSLVARVVVTVADAAGNRTVGRRSVRITG